MSRVSKCCCANPFFFLGRRLTFALNSGNLGRSYSLLGLLDGKMFTGACKKKSST